MLLSGLHSAWAQLPSTSRPAAQEPQLARQLEQVLDRDPRFDVAALSNQPEGDRNDSLKPNRELVDTFTVDGKSQQLELERTTLHSGVQVWLFAPESAQLIPTLAAMSSSSPIDR